MKILTTLATIAIILTPQVAQASDAHLKACTATQLAMLSANIKTYESFITGMDACRDAALDRLNRGIKDTDNPEALKEAQAFQKEMEALAQSREDANQSEPKTEISTESEVLIPSYEVVSEESF